jgi:hypothetical protein
VYDSIHSAKIIVFTKPILVSSQFTTFSKIQLFSLPSTHGSIVRMKPILGNIIEGFTEGLTEGFKEGVDILTTNVGYCQPIDETDPTIGDTAQVVTPMDGGARVNEATNTTIRTLLNFCAFFAIIIFVAVGVPPLYNLLFVKLVLLNIEFSPQKKLNRLCAIDIFISMVLFGLTFTLINTGIVNNLPLFTSMGFFIFIFFISCFLLLQFQRTYSPSSVEQFLKQFNETKNETEADASFEKTQNDLVGLIWDNGVKLFAESVKDESTGKSSIVIHFAAIGILIGIFTLLYFIMKWFGISKYPSSSVFLSFPFYAFILSVYFTVLWKTHIQKPLINPLLKTALNAVTPTPTST